MKDSPRFSVALQVAERNCEYGERPIVVLVSSDSRGLFSPGRSPGAPGLPRHGPRRRYSMSAFRNERPTDAQPFLSDVEGEIREFVRRDVAPFRKFPEGGEVFV